jgi:hypothetical protein
MLNRLTSEEGEELEGEDMIGRVSNIDRSVV